MTEDDMGGWYHRLNGHELLDHRKGVSRYDVIMLLKTMRESLPEIWHLRRDLEEVREQAIVLPKGRAFQAEGTINARVLAGKST